MLMFIFSDIYGEETNSQRLCNAVESNKLGEIIYTKGVENPKTGNIILVYTWHIEHENFKKWYAEERVRKLKKVGT